MVDSDDIPANFLSDVVTDANGDIVQWEIDVNAMIGAQSWFFVSDTYTALEGATLTEAGLTDGGQVTSGFETWDRVPTEPYAVYEYTGEAFEVFQDDPVPAGSYDSSMRIEVSVTLAQPLPPNVSRNYPPSEILAFSFRDGRHVVEDTGTLVLGGLTDANGDFVDWDTMVETTLGAQSLSIWTIGPGGTDVATLTESGGSDIAGLQGGSGSWVKTIVAAPAVPGLGLIARFALAGSMMITVTSLGRSWRSHGDRRERQAPR